MRESSSTNSTRISESYALSRLRMQAWRDSATSNPRMRVNGPFIYGRVHLLSFESENQRSVSGHEEIRSSSVWDGVRGGGCPGAVRGQQISRSQDDLDPG